LINWYNTPLTAAPVFPSLQAEGQAGGGYDLQLNRPSIPLFLQFKVVDRMERNTAAEARRSWLTARFYRMHLRPASRSKQHELLLKLENAGNEVYYAAPAFYEMSELNDAYPKRQVVARSIFIKPSAIGPLPDEKRHHIAFQGIGSTTGYFLSDEDEKKVIEFANPEHLSRALASKLEAAAPPVLDEAALYNLSEAMVRIMRETTSEKDWQQLAIDQTRARMTPLKQAAYFARSFFDSSFFVVQQKNE
jgi:hypothetical protein